MSNTTATAITKSSAKGSNAHSDHALDSPKDAYYTSLPAKHVEPLWLHVSRLVPPSPNPSAVPTIWRYAELLPDLMRAGELVSAEEAERRVLMLVNSALEAPCTTDTIYSGLQLVLPGEIAPAHRHVAFALRFIIEGSQGFTAVSGEKIVMERGDVILTPSWKWHDHGNEGSGPVIWLDGLDLPLFRFLPLNFATNYPEARYPSTFSASSTAVYKWAPVEKALCESKDQYARYHYRHQDGGHLSQTVSAQAERIAAGSTSPERQETVSFVYHVVAGQGYSTILAPNTQETQKILWSSKDTFAVPAWSKITHTCTSIEDDAFLFAINDRPMVEALGLWKDAAKFAPNEGLI